MLTKEYAYNCIVVFVCSAPKHFKPLSNRKKWNFTDLLIRPDKRFTKNTVEIDGKLPFLSSLM